MLRRLRKRRDYLCARQLQAGHGDESHLESPRESHVGHLHTFVHNRAKAQQIIGSDMYASGVSAPSDYTCHTHVEVK